MKKIVYITGLLLVFLAAFQFQAVQAEQSSMQTLIPIGSGYSQGTLQLFARAAAHRDQNGVVDLLVLPITYATDAYTITKGERRQNLELADERRVQIEQACNAVKLDGQTCDVVLAPVLVRSDAGLESNLELFVPDLDGMYILGGDQLIAMQVVANTPFERKMAEAFIQGAVVSGNSAGAAVQSRNMIAGYVGDYGPEHGFQEGIVDLWLYDGPEDETRGLDFGISNAIFEQHTFQRGRIARLINASHTTGLLGIGLDADTGAVVVDESLLSEVTGATAAIVVDLQTYAASGAFMGPSESLSIRSVATHLIPPGDFGYDIALRQPVVQGEALPAPALDERSYETLQLPAGSGPLILGGDLSAERDGSVAGRFVELSGGQTQARLVVLAVGYARNNAARAEAKAFATALQGLVKQPVHWFVLNDKSNPEEVLRAIDRASGILIVAADPSRIVDAFERLPQITSGIHAAWRAGKTLLVDNAAAAALGESISTDPNPTDSSLESDSMADFLIGGVNVEVGLGWLPGVVIEPRMVVERHWGRLYNQLYYNSGLLGLGIDAGTAVELSESGAQVWGRNTVVLLDGRRASFGLGDNDALSARYVLLSTFVEGEEIVP